MKKHTTVLISIFCLALASFAFLTMTVGHAKEGLSQGATTQKAPEGQSVIRDTTLECTCGNGALRFHWDEDDVLRVYTAEGQEPLLEIVPSFLGPVEAELISRGNRCNVLSLRGEGASLGVKLELGQPSFTLSVNRGASPVQVRWNPQAVVLPDIFAEDVVLEASEDERSIPAFLPMYMGLIQGENAVVAVIPYQAQQDAILSGDLKTLTLFQQNQEDYRFVINAVPGAWHQGRMPQDTGESVTDEAWSAPYPAAWMASIPMEADFLASGDGSRANWRVITIGKREDGAPVVFDAGQRMCVTNIASRQTWLGGFEGNFHYPVEFQQGKPVLHHTLFQNRDRVKISTDSPVFFYAYQRGNGSPRDLVMPWDLLPPWRQGQLYGTNTIGSYPATCDITNEVEKLFYKDEATEKAEYIRQQLVSMQYFVEGIRGRIENARMWREALLANAERQCLVAAELQPEKAKLEEILADVEGLYDSALETIQTPDVVWGFSMQIVKLAQSDLDADEKEDQAKELGRKIRTIGGGQDNLNAKMRHIGKNLRFRALGYYMTAQTPEAREFWKQAYLQTETLLQGYFGHDGK